MEQNRPPWKDKVHEVIFGHHTLAGRTFDVALLITILMSLAVIMLDSVSSIEQKYGFWLDILEWLFTGLFTIEYILRILTAHNPKRYVTSFFGIIDLLSTIPTYFGLFFGSSHLPQVIRTFRLIRVFRILGLSSYVGQANMLAEALKASVQKIIVFLVAVVSINVLFGTIMFMVEGPENGFTSIPRSVYWAIVTMTTVGYGDIAPQTPLGQAIAAFAMIIAYSIIAVPTGIVTFNLAKADEKREKKNGPITCSNCGNVEEKTDSNFCRKCGEPI
ncbi:ion transporter [bacterium SCSIO 12741]|nr:ion transporter [bacterium SCSIO 12741]